MRFLLVVAMVCIAVAYVTGGRLGNVARVPLRLLGAFAIALGLQLLLGVIASELRLPVLLGSYVVVALGILGLWRSRWSRGMPFLRTAVVVIAVGWALNAGVIALNGGMPVSRQAVNAAGITDESNVAADDFQKHVESSASTRLAALGDVIPIPGLEVVVSIGDVLLAAGIGLFLLAAMRPDPSPRPAARDRS